MSGITTGVGLISGIDYTSIIDQYMQIESAPILDLRTRVSDIDAQRAVFMELTARILAVKNSVLGFDTVDFFRRFSATSSNSDVLTATADASAAPGNYAFRVHSLVTSHALLSRGFANADSAPVGAGTLTLEVGKGLVNPATELDSLNGGEGVQRGVITITDRSGASVDVDLSTALTVQDMLEAINGAGLNVRASVTGVTVDGASGDRVVIEDTTVDDGSLGNLKVADKAGRHTAADLGIAANVAASRIDGSDLIRLTMGSSLSMLNDGNGVGKLFDAGDLSFDGAGGNELFTVKLTDILYPATSLAAVNHGNGARLGVIRITDRSGASAEVDLTNAVTAQDVLNALKAVEGVDISATIVNSHFAIRDTTGLNDEQAVSNFIIEDVSGHAAADLGFAANLEGDYIAGRDIYRIETIGDVIRAINYASGNGGRVRAALSKDGNGLTLRTDLLGETISVRDINDSTAATDLGLAGGTFDSQSNYNSRRLVAGLNTVLLHSLNGGQGIEAGTATFTDRTGATAQVDFSAAQTLQDVIDLINQADGVSLVAAVNGGGSGLEIRDESGGTGVLSIEDVSGSLAEDLNIAVPYDASNPFTENVVSSGNLQLQYVSRQTGLTELLGGRELSAGSFTITGSTGDVVAVNMQGSYSTVGQVIDSINASIRAAGNEHLEARLNDTGDGIAVFDTSGGTGTLEIEDTDGGRVAADLRLAGSARTGENFIDGSAEIRIEISASDTLQDVVEKINDAGGDFSAALFNDGSALNPYSLTLTSEVAGRAGRLVISTDGTDLGLDTLTQARDAVVSFGGAGSDESILVSSSTNTLDNVIEGVTFNLLAVSDEEVNLSITQDMDGIVDNIQTFVDAYNQVHDALDEATSFDAETYTRGTLFGDSTVNTVRDRLSRVIMREIEGVADEFAHAFQVGLGIGANRRLDFDEEEFREAYQDRPELVEDLFAHDETGFGTAIADVLDGLTRDFDGVLARKDDLLTKQQEQLNDRIDTLTVLLEAKRARLEAQFVGLEASLASLQGQQTALSALASLQNSS